MTCLMGLGPGKSFAGANPIKPSFCKVCWVYRESRGKSGSTTTLMFPETIEPLYWPPCLFFSLLGGNAALGGFGVNPLLLTRIEDGSNPVPLPFPTNSLPSATATAEGYWPVGMNPRTFDFGTLTILSAFFGLRTLSESSTTATALLWAFATYKVCSSSLSASPSGLAPGNASSASRTSMRSISWSVVVSITETLSAFELATKSRVPSALGVIAVGWRSTPMYFGTAFLPLSGITATDESFQHETYARSFFPLP